MLCTIFETVATPHTCPTALKRYSVEVELACIDLEKENTNVNRDAGKHIPKPVFAGISSKLSNPCGKDLEIRRANELPTNIKETPERTRTLRYFTFIFMIYAVIKAPTLVNKEGIANLNPALDGESPRLTWNKRGSTNIYAKFANPDKVATKSVR